MIDFNLRLHDTDKFRLAAIFFQQHGCYTLAPRGTTDYNKYWEQETDRCINGYTAPDGEGITGYNYFYLNYSPIMRLKEEEYTDREGNLRKRRQRILEFPSFWDYDYYYFCAIEQAELEGKHMAVLKCRQRGYSFKGGSMLVRNYMLIPGSKNFAIASEQKFLIGDGLLTKAWQIMDFLDKHTAWAKQRLVSTRMERTSGYKITDEFGKQTEQGYLSSITGITLKNDPERVRGTRAKLVLWEEGGKFPSLLDAWRIEQPSVETDDGKAFGLMIAFGTGGTEGASFEGLKELFYKPKSYNVLSFPNIWDEGRENTECAFFVPAYSNLESFDDDGNLVYMDRDGNSYKEKAIENLIDLRNKVKDGGASLQSIDRFISERPIRPAEAVLELGKNIFPRKLLMDQLTRIRTNKKLQSMKHIVDLEWDGNGQVKATEKPSGDITNYPLKKGDKPHGSVVIWEYPVKDPPLGLYIGGCDPYDHDDSFTNSLGSTFIFKRVRAGEAWTDVIVAEYSGRPDTAEEYYENVRKLLTFYNARLLFENERKGIYPYFTNKHCDYLLADLPDKIISEVFKDSKVQRRKGCHMTKQIRAYGEGLILEWLLDEFEEGHPNVERVYSEPLIEELIENDGARNVDRVIALCMVMIYREELYLLKVSSAKEQNKLVELFEMPLFSKQWFEEDSSTSEDGMPIFTF
ncbi:terminase large subunit [uncultured phage cr124_1]|uniref:Terminase n=2 Tax=Caudoviricetes TaxID=2731619 RepID=A0A7M1RUB4_9CAUD|nr:terminase large subunit [uncultured phage cr124_1]QOR57491.1 terminase [uncultured phage cr124_1]